MSLPSPRLARDLPAAGGSSGRRPVIVSAEVDADVRRALAALPPADADEFEAELDNAFARLAEAEPVEAVEATIGRLRVGRFAHALVYVVEAKRVVVAALVRARPRSPTSPG